MSTLTPPLPPSERAALGHAARKQLGRRAHASIDIHAAAHDPIALLRASEKDRIQSLVAIKHERMTESCFSFYRGAVPIMAFDLAAQPNTGLITQLCGDAHISNLGAFSAPAAGLSKGIAGGLTFDINDFDETIRGPFEFDVKRLATSLILGGREAGIKLAARHKAVSHFLARYREHMHTFAELPILELARYQIHRLAHIDPMPAILAQAERSTVDKTLKSLTESTSKSAKNNKASNAKALKGTGDTQVPQGFSLGSHKQASKKGVLTPEGAADRHFRSDPPLLRRITGKEADNVLASLGPYSRTLQPERRHFLDKYRPIDVGFKVVGTGSVGWHDYVIYLEGTHDCKSDPLFLQVKEETASAYAPYLPEGSQHTHNGHRVMDGQRAMQLTSDPFLGYTTIEGRDYLVRQLNDHKASIDLTTLTADSLLGYADLCGELFARGHARAGDPVAIAAYLGKNCRFDDAILSFAHNYADQTERYWDLFKKSLKPASPRRKSQRKG
ncbi:DUF2252 domain-containing protein [Granulicella sp. 5B5]|uniref:DUF2252 domain-containing protein n=1 Tax=Granulicella sp. 5B5 TaxID=1617967 RepID=UPI0015F6F6A0|nr:DUF2252 domain-containing protein [Granulicella sp. 5B5]QMV19940.1 DUF2252 domain-containing protein [Granulicella sp. 5B5]